MNLPWRGGLLFALLFAQDPTPPRPDLVAKYSAILDKGPDERRDLAARALLSLGRPGYEALKRAIAAKPEIAKAVVAPGDQPPTHALVRIPPFGTDEEKARLAVNGPSTISHSDEPIPGFGTLAEPFLWETLDCPDAHLSARAARQLRKLYTTPDGTPAGRPSSALRAELNRKRDFELTDRSLIDFLKGEPISWIFMSPRDERITTKLNGVTLLDVLRTALPKFAAVPIGDLLILIPPDRISFAEAGNTVWAPADLAPRIEGALVALAKGEDGPINGVTGVGAYHALQRAARSGGDRFTQKAGEMRLQLNQRVFFFGPAHYEGPPLTLSPATTAPATVAALEKSAGIKIEIADPARLEGSTVAFNFRGVPAKLAARALAFRLNHIY
ncbi:MAG TPA: hypothetical protein VFS19_01175 [Planctomycetota bacterium]|nr:hypothetical protein [Planctomycetota bacterium]